MTTEKDIAPSSLAEQIANDVNSRFNILWVSPFLVQLFIALSQQVREVSYNYLQSLKATLMVKKAKVVRDTQKANDLAKYLAEFRVATNIVFGTIDSVLQIVPIDSTLKVIPEVEDFLNTLASDIPIKIPESALANISGLGGFELLEGVTDYRSLKHKIDEIEFRATRATALSNYAQAGSAILDNQIQKIDVYLDIIITLDSGSL